MSATKTREEAARFVEQQFDPNNECPLNKGDQFHYGRQDVRALLDFIYGGAPASEEQMVKHRA